MGRIYYRADKRDFKVGAEIKTAGHFIEKHPPGGKATENLLCERKPNGKPNRGDCLMVFEDEECAKDYWAKMTRGLLYAVNIDESRILHRGDMNIVNQLAKDISLREIGISLADAYWRGEESKSPCIEILIASAIVLEKRGSEEERISRFKKLLGIK